jgi:formate transporter
MSAEGFSFDALQPAAMADKAEQIGIKKANAGFSTLFMLGILAGAFIGIGAIFATTVTAGAAERLPYGVIRLIGGLSFTVGMIMVAIGGAELFTGNTLIIMAYADHKVSLAALLRNWGVVYLGNFVGAIATAGLVFYAKQHTFGHGVIGANMLIIGESKSSLGFMQAVALGILCNAMVCMSVWMCYSARSNTDKILSIIPPIAGFVAAGFEHSVANMYFIPIALFVKYGASEAFFAGIGASPADYAYLTWSNFFFANLLPVTLGNTIGGVLMVGLIYWFIYLRKRPEPAAQSNPVPASD